MRDGEPLVDWAWIAAHLDDIALRSLQHLWIAFIAVAVGLAISLGLGILVLHRRSLFGPITAVTGVLYTIPSLALFAALIPVTGLSLLTAEIALVSYTLLILVRNIVAGLESVSPEVLEAAEGMGYPRRSLLWRVQLPLAVPLIVAGLRLASVSTIGLVTVAGLLGDAFGGLGVLITEGLQTFFATKVYVGALASIGLALLADVAFVRLQRRLTPWARAQALDATGRAAVVEAA
ncbi:MAG TPA: ABC transporter permease [Candidatus Limnocylindrales bacterium]|nr:ABC transporter permease [Candidatus Limnocylindrales bacterium]